MACQPRPAARGGLRREELIPKTRPVARGGNHTTHRPDSLATNAIKRTVKQAMAQVRKKIATSHRRIPSDPRHAVEIVVMAGETRQAVLLHDGQDQGIAREQFMLRGQHARQFDVRFVTERT